MSDRTSEAADGASASHALHEPASDIDLNVSSKVNPFSTKLDFSNVGGDDISSLKGRTFIQSALRWLLHDPTLRLILIVGVPLLAYCILSTP